MYGEDAGHLTKSAHAGPEEHEQRQQGEPCQCEYREADERRLPPHSVTPKQFGRGAPDRRLLDAVETAQLSHRNFRFAVSSSSPARKESTTWGNYTSGCGKSVENTTLSSPNVCTYNGAVFSSASTAT